MNMKVGAALPNFDLSKTAKNTVSFGLRNLAPSIKTNLAMIEKKFGLAGFYNHAGANLDSNAKGKTISNFASAGSAKPALALFDWYGSPSCDEWKRAGRPCPSDDKIIQRSRFENNVGSVLLGLGIGGTVGFGSLITYGSEIVSETADFVPCRGHIMGCFALMLIGAGISVYVDDQQFRQSVNKKVSQAGNALLKIAHSI
jgi:hypothetical protein